MKKLIILIVIALFSKSMIAQAGSSVTPPASVAKAFASQFPSAYLRKWEQRKEGFIADFRIKKTKLFAYYAPDGTWKGTEAPIKRTKNLPASVREGWNNSGYGSWYVLDLKKIDQPDGPLYTIHVNNGTLLDSDHHDAFLEEYVLFFSEKGELVRKDRMP
ncbi:MAG: PepSY-like domain-containing protein [Bacteroidetes bacterium]|nr:PepSY-like domain-containing protein [Bacteroidota bacterium]